MANIGMLMNIGKFTERNAGGDGGDGGDGGSTAPFTISFVYGMPEVVLVASGTTNSESFGYSYGMPVPVYDAVNF